MRRERWRQEQTGEGGWRRRRCRQRAPYQGEGRVEEGDEDVGHGQVDDEEAGGRVHALVPADDMAHQDVAEERDHDDDSVGHHQQRLHGGLLRLGPVAPLSHKVLPVGESIVAPEEVGGVGHGPLRVFGGGLCQGQEEEQEPQHGRALSLLCTELLGFSRIARRRAGRERRKAPRKRGFGEQE